MKTIASILSASLVALAFAGEAHAGLCAYAVADIEGEVLAHPVVVVQLNEGSVDIDPVLVHVDSTSQTVLGYSIATPEVNYQTDPISIFIPGIDDTVEEHVHALFDLEAAAFACLHGTVATPAIPIYIPASSLQIPGTQTDVPAITVNWLGQNITYPGKVIQTDGHEIYVPSIGFAVPPVNVTVPDKAIAVTIANNTEIIPVLAPLVIDDPEPLP